LKSPLAPLYERGGSFTLLPLEGEDVGGGGEEDVFYLCPIGRK